MELGPVGNDMEAPRATGDSLRAAPTDEPELALIRAGVHVEAPKPAGELDEARARLLGPDPAMPTRARGIDAVTRV